MNYRLKTDIYYTDGTSDTNVNVTAVITIEQYATQRFAVGYNVIYPLSDSAKTISKYDIYLDDTGSPAARRTPRVTYKVNENTFLDTQLLYESSTGAYETLMLQGRKTEGIEVIKEEFESILPFNYGAESGNIKHHNIRYMQSWQVATGFKPKEEFKTIVDLLISEHIYIYVNGSRVKVLIDTNSFELIKDDNYHYSLNLKLVKAFNQNNYSNIKQ